MKQLLTFLANVDGRDKYLKVIQYSAKIIQWRFSEVAKSKKLTPTEQDFLKRIGIFVSSLSAGRKVFRLFNWTDPLAKINAWLKNGLKLTENRSQNFWTVVDVIVTVLSFFTSVFEDLGTMCGIGIFEASRRRQLDMTSSKFWFISLLINIGLNLRDTRELRAERATLHAEIAATTAQLEQAKLSPPKRSQTIDKVSLAQLALDLQKAEEACKCATEQKDKQSSFALEELKLGSSRALEPDEEVAQQHEREPDHRLIRSMSLPDYFMHRSDNTVLASSLATNLEGVTAATAVAGTPAAVPSDEVAAERISEAKGTKQSPAKRPRSQGPHHLALVERAQCMLALSRLSYAASVVESDTFVARSPYDPKDTEALLTSKQEERLVKIRSMLSILHLNLIKLLADLIFACCDISIIKDPSPLLPALSALTSSSIGTFQRWEKSK